MASGRVLIGKDLEGLEKGDLVEFTTTLLPYSHWGVYIGDQTVIHVTGTKRGAVGQLIVGGKNYQFAKLVEANIFDAAKGKNIYKNNCLDDKMTPGTPDEIVAYAKARLGPVAYDLFTNNCEHYAVSFRYGVERSGQVDKFLSIIKKIEDAAADVAQAGRKAVNKVRGRNYNQAQGGAF